MMKNAILYSEINVVCSAVLLLLCIKVKQSMFIQSHRHLFFKVIVSNMLFLLLDSVWIFANNKQIQISVIINWLLNGLYYMLSGLLGYYWLAFSETVQESRFVRDSKCRKLALIPLLLLIVLTILSFKTGLLFYIDDQNIYHRGPAYALQLLTSYGYVAFTAGKAFLLSFRTTDYRRKSELQILATFVLPTLFAGTLQVLFPGYPILCIGNTFGILYIYLTLQERLISLDPLTKLNNRNQLLQYLSTKITHLHEDRDLYLLIMDIDYFKAINDKYGHIEGDMALKCVAGALMQACSNRKFFISRYGGDEFVAICELDQKESIQPVCESIHQKLREAGKPYTLSLSIGHAIYTPDIRNQQEFIERADKELYKIKKARPLEK